MNADARRFPLVGPNNRSPVGFASRAKTQRTPRRQDGSAVYLRDLGVLARDIAAIEESVAAGGSGIDLIEERLQQGLEELALIRDPPPPAAPNSRSA